MRPSYWFAAIARAGARRAAREGAVRLGVILTLAGFMPAAPARAAVTLYEKDQTRLEMEFRLMAWGVQAGPDLIPSGTEAPPDQEGEIYDFFVRRARILVRAKLSSALEIYLQAGQDNIGSKVLKDDAGFRFKDAMLNFRHTDGLQLAVGQFKVPFLRQNLESGFNQLLVDRSIATAIRPAVEGQRDDGGMIWGNHGGMQYRVAVFDGADQEDTNSHSGLRGSARVSYNWFTREPTYGFTGTTFGQQKILQVGGQGDWQDGRTDPRDATAFQSERRDYRAWAFDYFYEQPYKSGWALVTEGAWIQRRDDYLTDGFDTLSTHAGYVQAGVRFPWEVGIGHLQVFGRYELLDTDRGAVSTDVRGRTFGLTWFLKGHDRKIQFDHVTLHESPVESDNDAYRLSFAATF
jgi:Phosphate-selective porin O and P